MTEFLDLLVLRRLVTDLGDEELVRETVALYLAELPARGDEIAGAADRGDLPALRFAAHTLGSSSALLGAEELHRLCRQLELREDTDDPAVRTDLLGRWREARTRTEQAMRGWLEVQGSNR